MKVPSLFALMFFIASIAFADDGVFYANGNTLVPIHESTISLKKEVLKLKDSGDHLYVDVYFEFDNPGKERREAVGFVTPPGGYAEESFAMPFVSNFKVSVNDSNLAYKLTTFEKSGLHASKSFQHWIDTGDFIFYFPAVFRHGLNIVRHSYAIKAGSGQSDNEEYIYRLVTGTTWANNEMEDFTLSIDMGKDVYFYLPTTFWKSGEAIPWQIEGDGIISGSYDSNEELQREKMTIRFVKMHSGIVTCHMMHFKPDYDLGFAVPRVYATNWWSKLWAKPGASTAFPDSINSQCSGYDLSINYQGDTFENATDKTLYYLQNLPFAIHDCEFKNEELTNLFSQYNWYYPVKGRTPDTKYLNAEEKMMLNAILKKQARRKK